MKYECQLCGACCSPGFIEDACYTAAIARVDDRPVIAAHFGMSDAELCAKYKINQSDGHMRTDKEPCRFLASDKKCSIHEIKPRLCTAYPWNNIFENPITRLEYAARCPGIALDAEDVTQIRVALEAMNDNIIEMHRDEVLSTTPDPVSFVDQLPDKPSQAECRVVVDVMRARQDKARELFYATQHVKQ